MGGNSSLSVLTAVHILATVYTAKEITMSEQELRGRYSKYCDKLRAKGYSLSEKRQWRIFEKEMTNCQYSNEGLRWTASIKKKDGKKYAKPYLVSVQQNEKEPTVQTHRVIQTPHGPKLFRGVPVKTPMSIRICTDLYRQLEEYAEKHGKKKIEVLEAALLRHFR